MSLRYRLLVPLLGLLLADVGVTGWAAWDAANRAEERIDLQLQSVVRTLSEPPTYPLTTPVLVKMKKLSGAEYVFVRRTGEMDTTFDPPPSSFAPALEVTVDGEPYRVMWLVLPEGHPNAGGMLSVCYPESLRREAVRGAVAPPLVLGAAVAITALALLALGTRVVNRIRQQQQQTRTIAAGDFRPGSLPNPDDELRELADDVNALATKLSEYERELRHTERLRILGQFSGGLAHQLRNAAGGAKLAVQLYLSEQPDGDREPLDVALRQLARMESNLSQFLSLGKPPPTSNKPVDLTQVLSTAVELYRPQCRHACIELVWQQSSEIWINGDAVQLGHLFGNLIGNAVEACGAGGRVEIRANPDRAGGEIAIEVRDTGPGPSPAIVDRLFEAFVTGKEQGVGLGLAVAKQAADAHHARIDWFRENGTTVFRVTFGRG